MANILIVDDEPEIRYAISRAVESMGHVVTEATDKEDAEQALSSMPIDVIVCDLQLPNMRALDIVRSARKRHEDVAIVLVAGDGLANYEPYIAQARDMKVGAILRKPFDYDALLGVVNRLTPPFSAVEPKRRIQANRA